MVLLDGLPHRNWVIRWAIFRHHFINLPVHNYRSTRVYLCDHPNAETPDPVLLL